MNTINPREDMFADFFSVNPAGRPASKYPVMTVDRPPVVDESSIRSTTTKDVSEPKVDNDMAEQVIDEEGGAKSKISPLVIALGVLGLVSITIIAVRN